MQGALYWVYTVREPPESTSSIFVYGQVAA